MLVNGCDCSIVIKTAHVEKDIPYTDETLREAVSVLEEQASIEGDGLCRAIHKKSGVTGCVVTPLTIGTAPLLLYLAMGTAGNPVFVSETRKLFKYELNLLPIEDTEHFDLIQDRKNERRFFEGCRVKGFELRVMRDEAIKLKIDIYGERAPRSYPYTDTFIHEKGELYNGANVTYTINGKVFSNIYGLTLVSKKAGGTRTELWIKRALQYGTDIPAIIEDITITAVLLREKYDYRNFGVFRITIKRLVLVSDETEINCGSTVIGPLRYYVSGSVSTEVFTSSGEIIP